MSAAARLAIPGTDLLVSPLCLGCNRLGAQLDQDQSFALLDAFVEAGGNFFDTAHVYADWLPDVERSCSEKTLGRWLAARGSSDGIVVATKIGHPRLETPAMSRINPRTLRQDVTESLENFRAERLDLVYLHRDDPSIPAEDILAMLEELREHGSIRYYAASNWSTGRLEEAARATARNDWAGFCTNQAEWSLAQRNTGSFAADLVAMDSAMIAWHRRTGTAAVPYSSQAAGYFDKLAHGTLDNAAAGKYDNPHNRSVAATLTKIANDWGLTPTQAMLALFTLAPFPVIPVVGCGSPDQIRSSFRGVGAALSKSDLTDLLQDLGLISEMRRRQRDGP